MSTEQNDKQQGDSAIIKWLILFEGVQEWEEFSGTLEQAMAEAVRDNRHMNYGHAGYRIVQNLVWELPAETVNHLEDKIMSNKATIEIDCDAETVTVFNDDLDWTAISAKAVETTKAELVAHILAMQSKELMAMSKQELMERHLKMLELKE
jgi:hypothetical protein